MDIVYVFKPSIRKSIELRYSLMFLSNIQHDNVYLIGDMPFFVKNIKNINYIDGPNRIQNVKSKYNLIIENKDISDNFILMHDDIYAINQIREIKPYIRGTLQEHLDIIEKNFGRNGYYKHIELVKDIFPYGLSYETHTPAIFNKHKFAYILEKYKGLGATKSLYYNHYEIEGTRLPEDKQDCKIYNSNSIVKEMLNLPYISSDNSIAYNDKFRELLDSKLKNISKRQRFKYLNY